MIIWPQVLVSKYGLSNIDALLAYDKFFKRFPSGEIKKEDFMEEYKVTKNISWVNTFKMTINIQDNIMAEAFFRVFDEDKSGALSFYEYMLVKTAPNLENTESKLGWIFQAFDNDGGGTIDKSEAVLAIFWSI